MFKINFSIIKILAIFCCLLPIAAANGNSIHDAVLEKNIQQLQHLLNQGANVDAKIHYTDNSLRVKNITALSLAAFYNTPEIVTILLKAGANIHAVDDDGLTPLMFAIMGNAPNIAQILINHGANLELGGDYQLKYNNKKLNFKNFNPLMLATANYSPPLASLLIKHGANPNARADFFYAGIQLKVTPLIVAAMTNSVAVAKILIAHGADINGKDNFGNSVLFYAQTAKDQEMINLLTPLGAR